MVIHLGSELEAALIASAQRLGIDPEVLALDALRERFLNTATPIEPQDEWERELIAAASDCGVSLPHSALSSAELYE
jgi:hypothetical protein